MADESTKKLQKPILTPEEFELEKKALEKEFAKTELGKELKKKLDRRQNATLKRQLWDYFHDEEKAYSKDIAKASKKDFNNLSPDDKAFLNKLARKRATAKTEDHFNRIMKGIRKFKPDYLEDTDTGYADTRAKEINNILDEAVKKGELPESLKASYSHGPTPSENIKFESKLPETLSESLPSATKTSKLGKLVDKLPQLGALASGAMAVKDLAEDNEVAAGIDVLQGVLGLGGMPAAVGAAALEAVRPAKTVSEEEEMKELDERKFRQIQNMLKQRGISSEEFEK